MKFRGLGFRGGSWLKVQARFPVPDMMFKVIAGMDSKYVGRNCSPNNPYLIPYQDAHAPLTM